MRKIITLIVALAACCSAFAQRDTIYVSTLYTTHIVFATDITYTDNSNKNLVAGMVVKENRNMVALRAREPFTTTCSVTALESNGKLHTFIVAHKENPEALIIDTRNIGTIGEAPVSATAHTQPRRGGASSGIQSTTTRSSDAPLLSDVYECEQDLFHITTKRYDIEVACANIYAYSDITYLILTIDNKSGISYEPDNMSFVIESKKAGKRTIKVEKNVYPKNKFGTLLAAPKQTAKIAYSLDKLTLAKDQVLKIYLYENKGQRNMELTLSERDINRAISPKIK